jgi:hypothetical protein
MPSVVSVSTAEARSIRQTAGWYVPCSMRRLRLATSRPGRPRGLEYDPSVFVPEVHWTLERDRFRQRYGDHRCTCGDIHACCTYLAFRALCCNSIPVAGTCTAQCARGARSKAAWRDAPLLRTAKAERARRGRNSSERCPSTKNHTRHLCSPIKPTLSSFLRSAHACPVRGSIEILDRPRVCGRRSEHTLPSDDAAVPCLLSRADRAGGDSPRLWCKC